MEFIEWVAHLSLNESLVTAKNASNALLLSYVLLSVHIKDCRFLAAFFMCQIWADYLWVKDFGEIIFYLVNSLIYINLYWLIQKYKYKTILFCIIMILFDMVMMVDAKVNAGIEGFFYTYYVRIIVFIHFCIIISLVKWNKIRSDYINFIKRLLVFCSASYYNSLSLLQYKNNIKKQK